MTLRTLDNMSNNNISLRPNDLLYATLLKSLYTTLKSQVVLQNFPHILSRFCLFENAKRVYKFIYTTVVNLDARYFAPRMPLRSENSIRGHKTRQKSGSGKKVRKRSSHQKKINLKKLIQRSIF